MMLTRELHSCLVIFFLTILASRVATRRTFVCGGGSKPPDIFQMTLSHENPQETTLNTRVDGKTAFHVASSNPATEASRKRATETKGEEASDEGRPLRSFRSRSQVEESEMPPLWFSHGLPWWDCSEMGLRLVQFY